MSKAIELSEETFEFLKNLQEELKTQDNHCTADPIYQIRQRERIYGMDPEYGDDNYVWVDEEDTEHNYEPDDFSNMLEYLVDVCEIDDPDHVRFVDDDEYRDDIMMWHGFEKRFYMLKEVVASTGFLTRKAAFEHMKRKAHWYQPDAYVFADSLYRNHEMIDLRNILINLKLD